MLEIQTQIDIQASPARIWAILTDFAHYCEWNPFIVAAAGIARPGQTLSLTLAVKPGRMMRFRPKVLHARASDKLVWRGRLLVPGLFDGEHCFTLSPLEDGSVRLSHSEQFRGLLVPLLRRSLERDTRAGFERMNQALRERAERHNRQAHR